MLFKIWDLPYSPVTGHRAYFYQAHSPLYPRGTCVFLDEWYGFYNSCFLCLTLPIPSASSILRRAPHKAPALPCWPDGSNLQGWPKQPERDVPDGPVIKNLPYNAGDKDSIPGQGINIPHATKKLSPHTVMAEPGHCGAYVPQLRPSAATCTHT